MDNYEDRKGTRRFLIGAASIGAISAAVVNRKKLGGYIINGVERFVSKFATGSEKLGNLSITNLSNEIRAAMSETLPLRLRQQVAEERFRATGVFSREQVDLLLGYNRGVAPSSRINQWLHGGTLRSSVIQEDAYRDFVASVGGNIPEIQKNLERAFDQSNLTTLFNKDFPLSDNLRAQLQRAREVHAEAFIDALQRRVVTKAKASNMAAGRGPTYMDALMEQLGARRVTVNDVLSNRDRFSADVVRQAQESSARLRASLSLSGHREGLQDIINSTAVGQIWMDEKGTVRDLRGFKETLGRAIDWVDQNMQIPVLPYLEGFSPTQFFGWLKGGTGRTFDIIHQNAVARQPLTRHLAAQGQDLTIAGNTLIGSRFSELGNASIGELGKGYTSLTADSGFVEDIYKNLTDYLDTPKTGGVRGALGFGHGGTRGTLQLNQREQSWFGKVKSIFAKMNPGSTYPAAALNDIYNNPDFDPVRNIESIRSVVNFLKKEGNISQNVLEGILDDVTANGGYLPIDLRVAANNLDSNSHLLHYLLNVDRKAIRSDEFRYFLEEFDRDPARTLGKKTARNSVNPLVDMFLGKEEPLTGYDTARKFIKEEVLRNINLGGPGQLGRGIEDIIVNLDVPINESRDALAVRYGYLLGDQLTGISGARGAYQGLVGSQHISEDIRLTAEAMVDAKLGYWDTWNPEISNGPQRLFIKEHQSILESINRAWQNGGNFFDVLSNITGSTAIKQYTTALWRGVDDPEDMTRSALTWYFFNSRLNKPLEAFGLGLGPEAMGSGGKILRGLIMQRIVPAVLGIEAWNYVNWESENLFGTSPNELKANVRANAKIAFSHLNDWERYNELHPGMDNYLAGTTPEDTKKQLESGYVPVRRGRLWLFGSRSPIYGDKIKYYMPDPYQLAYSNWQDAENADMRSDAYWAHSLLPTPRHPLAPVMRFLDPMWWEQRHSMGDNPDRPYVVSGPIATRETLWGPLVNSTIGRIFKPERVLYPEYLPENMGKTQAKEGIRAINMSLKGGGTGGGGDPYTVVAAGSIATVNPAGGIAAEQIGEIDTDTSHLGTRDKGNNIKGLAKWEIERINRNLKATGAGLTPSRMQRLAEQTGGFTEEDLEDMRTISDMEMAGYLAREYTGLYGWATSIPFGQRTGPVIADTGEAYSYEQRFWNANLGGLGGELSEIGRRFMPHKLRNVERYNPVPNSMQYSFMPGSDYFLNFQEGDPYTKVENGLVRLPGEAYERVHRNRLMQTRASSLGRTKEQLILEMLGYDEGSSAYSERVMEEGTASHKAIQRKWNNMGILKGKELEIFDPALGITGHMDAILNMGQGDVVAEIKTMSAKRFALGQPFQEHMEQLNFYLYESGIHKGMLAYVNRDDPNQVRLINVDFSKSLLNQTIAKVEAAREDIRGMVERGEVSRATLYDPVTRFEILADTSPWSMEYLALKDQMANNDQLTENENERVQAAKHRATLQKRRYNFYPYRFKYADVETHRYIVKDIIDANTISVYGDEHPLRLAGIRNSIERITDAYGAPEGNMTPAEYLFSQFGVHKGSVIKVLVNADPQNRYSDDVLGTQHAVIIKNGKNINRELLESGVGTEKNEWTAAGVWARFSAIEISKGAKWESMAHMRSILNTKFLDVKSPYEEYERQTYGSRSARWEAPYSSFINPSITSFMGRGILGAAAGAGLFSSFFFSQRNLRWKAAGWGALAGAGLSLIRQGVLDNTDDMWVPKRTQKRRDIEEYFDILKYMKYRALYARTAELAKEKEGVDVDRLYSRYNNLGKWRKEKLTKLRQQRQQLLRKGKKGTPEELRIRQEIQNLAERKQTLALGPLTNQAMLYRDKYAATMYGAMPGGPLLNVMAAFPKYEREFIQGFLTQSTPEEREKAFKLMPDYQKRLIGPYMGIDPKRLPQRKLLREYFKTHTLPDKDWKGWSPGLNLDDIKAKAIVEEGMDPMDFGIYPSQIYEAKQNTQNIDTPTVYGSSSDISDRINKILSGRGLKNLRIVIATNEDANLNNDELNVDLAIKQKREQDLLDALRSY